MKIRQFHFLAGDQENEFQISPMIDVVFLLIAYFIVTATLKKNEADLTMQLPAMVRQEVQLTMPDEQIIEIREDGSVILNDREFDSPESQDLPELVDTLERFRETSEAANGIPMVTIQPDDEAVHARVMDVLNACAASKIERVGFAAAP
jgi:biopolymer transport protein ExbD